MIKKSKSLVSRLVLLSFGLASPLFASSSGGGSALPWEGPLQRVIDSLTGPVATGIGTLALFVAGGMLIFGSEIADFTKRVLYAVLAASIMLLGAQLLSAIGLGGSLI